jgi:hypothetical protein
MGKEVMRGAQLWTPFPVGHLPGAVICQWSDDLLNLFRLPTVKTSQWRPYRAAYSVPLVGRVVCCTACACCRKR